MKPFYMLFVFFFSESLFSMEANRPPNVSANTRTLSEKSFDRKSNKDKKSETGYTREVGLLISSLLKEMQQDPLYRKTPKEKQTARKNALLYLADEAAACSSQDYQKNLTQALLWTEIEIARYFEYTSYEIFYHALEKKELSSQKKDSMIIIKKDRKKLVLSEVKNIYDGYCKVWIKKRKKNEKEIVRKYDLDEQKVEPCNFLKQKIRPLTARRLYQAFVTL